MKTHFPHFWAATREGSLQQGQHALRRRIPESQFPLSGGFLRVSSHLESVPIWSQFSLSGGFLRVGGGEVNMH